MRGRNARRIIPAKKVCGREEKEKCDENEEKRKMMKIRKIG